MASKNTPDSVSYLLVQVCKSRRNLSNMLLAEAGIYSGQDILLYYLSLEDGQTVSALVEKMCIQHATISNMIDRMETAGMIRKEKDLQDKRASRIYMTDNGKLAMAKVADVWRDMEAKATAGFTGKQKNDLSILLKQVLSNLE